MKNYNREHYPFVLDIPESHYLHTVDVLKPFLKVRTFNTLNRTGFKLGELKHFLELNNQFCFVAEIYGLGDEGMDDLVNAVDKLRESITQHIPTKHLR